MLNQLNVKNFALIESLTLSLGEGLNIITGETGAGKSILLGALGLLSGKRADLSVVREGAKKCVVEGEFLIEGYGLEEFFSLNDLDYEEHSIIRREIASNGKSRAFINDTPVNLNVLKELGELIIDIHSQHSNLLLAKPEFSFQLLDGFADQLEALKAYKSLFKQWSEKKNQLSLLEEKQASEKLNLEFNQFQLKELLDADLKEGEQEELEKEFELLNNAEEIKSKAAIVVNNIIYNNSSVQELSEEALNALEKLSLFDADYEELKERLKSALIEIKDIAEDVEQRTGGLSSDASRVQEIDDRLGLLFSLQKKYNVSSVEYLIEKREALKKLVEFVEGGSEELDHLRKEIENIEQELNAKASLLSKARSEAGKEVAKLIVEDLRLLGIEQTQLSFEIEKTELNANGCDHLDILFSANKGKSLGKLTKTASGGELSRVMLSLKKIMSSKTNLPTIVFDEIDTGVSGEVANQMGILMKQMGSKMQVITITHLPQIAAKGNVHFKVSKSHESEITTSQIRNLDADTRVIELAQMLSGAQVTEAAKQNALELLNQV